MAYTNPSVAQFQSQFSRDFPYGSDPTTSVLDSDITYAFTMVNFNISQPPPGGEYGLTGPTLIKTF